MNCILVTLHGLHPNIKSTSIKNENGQNTYTWKYTTVCAMQIISV